MNARDFGIYPSLYHSHLESSRHAKNFGRSSHLVLVLVLVLGVAGEGFFEYEYTSLRSVQAAREFTLSEAKGSLSTSTIWLRLHRVKISVADPFLSLWLLYCDLP